jgi:hypothetical protein
MRGDPARRIIIGNIAFLPESFLRKIDRAGDCWEWTGSKNLNGYGNVNVWVDSRKTTARAHRIAYALANGEIPEGLEVDHVCHNRGCVNSDHLRLVTRKQNSENPSDLLMASNTSGYRGVTWCRQSRKWTARVTHNKRSVFVGSFDSAGEAGAAAAAKRLELFTHNDVDRVRALQ